MDLTNRAPRRCLLAALLIASATGAGAQPCQPAWSDEFGAARLRQDTKALAFFDDGSGEALYAAGSAQNGGSYPGVYRWDGSDWDLVAQIGAPTTPVVYSLAVFDDGTGGGPALYAAGLFTLLNGRPTSYIARYDGVSWSSVGAGLNNTVRALCVYDDGSGAGPALYAAGYFTTAGGGPANGVARWDGSSWAPLAGGLTERPPALYPNNGPIGGYGLGVFDDDGPGPLRPALYVGGVFVRAGGIVANSVARWDGAAWTTLGPGIPGAYVTCFAGRADPDSMTLYAGGLFNTNAGAADPLVLAWDGTAWSPVGKGLNAPVPNPPHLSTLALFDEGGPGGPTLYAGGNFAGPWPHELGYLARWDGADWTIVEGTPHPVRALLVRDEPEGPALYAGGEFYGIDGLPIYKVARRQGGAWSGFQRGFDGSVRELAVYDDGRGPKLYAAGSFSNAGQSHAIRLAAWDGDEWSPVGGGLSLFDPLFTPFVQRLVSFDDGGGSELYIWGRFSTVGGVPVDNMAKWDGAAWSPVPDAMTTARPWAVLDIGEGPTLYGFVLRSPTNPELLQVVRWTGAAWEPLGGPTDTYFTDMAVFDDGGGPALYVTGRFNHLDGVPARNIARWNGQSWLPLADGFAYGGAPEPNLAVYNDGSGPALYVGGVFTEAGGLPVNHIAKWDGATWSDVGGGVTRISPGPLGISTLGVYDDGAGSGPALYAAGFFSRAGGVPCNGVARWDGTAWSPLDGGLVNAGVNSAAVFNDGRGPALFFGGTIIQAGEHGSMAIAKWTGCACRPDLDADGTLDARDFLIFLSLYAAGDGRADFDSSGVTGIQDFLAFLTAYAAGCP